MNTTRALLATLAIINSAFPEDDSKPFDPTESYDYQQYTENQIPLPKIYLDRKTRTFNWVKKKYGLPRLPTNVPKPWQFLGKTTSAAKHGEWFCLYKLVYPESIKKRARYVYDKKRGVQRRIVGFVIEIRYFPKTNKPSVVYDAHYYVEDLGASVPDMLNISNPAFPPVKWDPNLIKRFSPYIAAAKTDWERAVVRNWALNIIESENEQYRRYYWKKLENFKNRQLLTYGGSKK